MKLKRSTLKKRFTLIKLGFVVGCLLAIVGGAIYYNSLQSGTVEKSDSEVVRLCPEVIDNPPPDVSRLLFDGENDFWYYPPDGSETEIYYAAGMVNDYVELDDTLIYTVIFNGNLWVNVHKMGHFGHNVLYREVELRPVVDARVSPDGGKIAIASAIYGDSAWAMFYTIRDLETGQVLLKEHLPTWIGHMGIFNLKWKDAYTTSFSSLKYNYVSGVTQASTVDVILSISGQASTNVKPFPFMPDLTLGSIGSNSCG